MSYWSVSFLAIFLPVVIVLYNLMPRKFRWVILLLASYGFIWIISNKLIIYIIATTLLTYFGGLWINKVQVKRDTELQNVDKEKKKEIIKKAFFGPITPEIPASILQLHRDITVIYSENWSNFRLKTEWLSPCNIL